MKTKPQNIKFDKKAINSLGSLAKYSKKYSVAFLTAMIFAGLGALINLVGPSQIGKITDIITDGIKVGNIDMSAILGIVALLLIIYSVNAIFLYAEGWIMATVTARLSKKMRKDIASKVNRVPLKYFDGTTYGNVLSRVTNDVDTVGQSLNNSLTTIVSAVALFLGSLIMMFVTNWIMALSAIGATIIGFGIMFLIMGKSQKYFIMQQESLGQINGHIEEVYSSHSIIKAYNATTESTAKFNKYNNNLYKSAWKSQFLSGLMMPLMNFMGNLGYLVVCVVGVLLSINGAITFGVVVSFMIYIRFFMQPLSQIAQSMTSLQSASAASGRIFEFLNEKELEDETQKIVYLNPEEVHGKVEFKNVRFGYSPEKPVIKNFSAQIKAGQKVAIVGPTGAGKTTLVNLLMRFYEIDDGEILIDGVNIKQIKRENVHNLFSMVLQDTWLFEASIKDNIKYSKQNVSDNEIHEACRACGVEHFIKTLPKGYDTILSDETAISAGQKQLLTIARAMVQNSPMLILDEATSSVDTRTEILIQKAMDALTEDKTSFVIAHRLSTIRNSDLILVLKDGDIIEQGTHKELLEKGGFYAELYNSQFEE